MAIPNIVVVTEPVESDRIVYLAMAPPTKGASRQGQLSLELAITNNETAPVLVTQVRLHFEGSPAVPGVAYFPNLTVVQGTTAAWGFRAQDSVLLPQPAPPRVRVEVLCYGFSDPWSATFVLAPHVSPVLGDSFLFPARASDLRSGEYWSGLGAGHGSGGGQLFAYDLDVVGRGGDITMWNRVLPGKSGAQNDHYRIWGKPIYAMADGVVSSFLNTQDDNTVMGPQTPPPGFHAGNHFYIQHGGEVVLYAHFVKGSLNPDLMKTNAEVRAGDFLGLAGNSGHSTNPHLHIHSHKKHKLRPLPFRNTWMVDGGMALAPPAPTGPWFLSHGHGFAKTWTAILPAVKVDFAAQVCVAAGQADDLHLLAIDRSDGLFHTVRKADGSWPFAWGDVQGAIRAAGNPDVGPTKLVACAPVANGDLHLLVLDRGDGLFHTVRKADGSWPFAWGDVQGAIRAAGNPDVGPTKLVSCAPVANGDLHLLVLDRGDGLFHTVRKADGSWPFAWGDVQGAIRAAGNPDVGPTKLVSCAPVANGDLHILVLDRGDGLFHTVRKADGSWPFAWGDVQGAIRAAGNPDVGPTKLVACAPGANGDVHLLVLDRSDGLWHTVRKADGSWPFAWGDVQGAIRGAGNPGVGPTKLVSCAAVANGDLHLLVLDRSDGLWHTVRKADGSWPFAWSDLRAAVRWE